MCVEYIFDLHYLLKVILLEYRGISSQILVRLKFDKHFKIKKIKKNFD